MDVYNYLFSTYYVLGPVSEGLSTNQYLTVVTEPTSQPRADGYTMATVTTREQGQKLWTKKGGVLVE